MFILGFSGKNDFKRGIICYNRGFFFSVFLKFLPGYTDLSFLSKYSFAIRNKASGLYEIPFLDRMAIVFIICIIGMVLISKTENARGVVPKGLKVDSKCSEYIRDFYRCFNYNPYYGCSLYDILVNREYKTLSFMLLESPCSGVIFIYLSITYNHEQIS